MRYILLALTLFCVTTLGLAQPVITSSINPVAGDIFYAHGCDPTGVTPGTPGALVTWDFSSLVSSGIDTMAFVVCSATPYCDSFPGANLAFSRPAGYNYFIANTATFANNGVYTTDRMYYSDPENIFKYPMTYATVFTDSTYGVDRTTGEYYSISDTSIADGYGTLKLPGATYTNVLRLHKSDYSVDSFAGTVPWAIRGHSDQYIWVSPATRFILMNLYIDQPPTGVPLVDVSYYESNATSVHDIGKQVQMSVSPNPAHDNASVSFFTSDAQHTSLDLTDMTGRSMALNHDPIVNGANKIELALSMLSPGVYLLRVNTPDGAGCRKVEVF